MNFANFSIEESWDGGFVGYLTFENFTDAPLKNWKFEFTAPFAIGDIWDADIVRKQGNRYTVSNVAWNETLAAGDRISFGFVATLPKGNIGDTAKWPRNFRLNNLQGPNLQGPNPSPEPPTAPSPDNPPNVDEPLAPVGGNFNYGEALQWHHL